ncbi:hypothetical protein NESM_000935700 [Novymonas esmeraldas]|uniref:Uncharacterized protein n=1 Tax=Novymonas esmeraldas TaxID=1808958 RepID=A0AAW0F192_9TRYP
MYSAVRDIEGLSRTHLPPREDAYRPIEERLKILALMEGTMLAQVLSFMVPHRCLTICAVSPTARVCAELIQVSDTRVPFQMSLDDRLFHECPGSLDGDDEKERLRHYSWWLVKCGLPLHLDHSSTWTVLRAIAPALVPMVRSSPLSTDDELQASDILQLEEMHTRGDWAISIANVSPSQLTHLRRLTVKGYDSEVYEDFLLQLPGLTELFIDEAYRMPVSLKEPAYAARLLRLDINKPTRKTVSWMYKCTSVTHLSIIRCGSVLDVASLVELPYVRNLDMTGSNVPHLDGLSRSLTLTSIVVKECSQLLSLEGLVGAPQLRSIDASDSGVRTLGELHRCPHLTTVDFCCCSRLEILNGLVGAPQLQSIRAAWSGVRTIGELHRCLHLRKVNFSNCSELLSLAGLAGAPKLEEIDAFGSGVRTIGDLNCCPRLTSVSFDRCRNLESLEGLVGAPQLEGIDVSDSGVRTIGDLNRCPRLTTLLLLRCLNLESLEGLAGAPQLEWIDASGAGVRTIGELYRCPRLRTVGFKRCRNLESIAGLSGAPQLQTVDATRKLIKTWHHS